MAIADVRMGERRFDIVPLGRVWRLTDSGRLGLDFQSPTAALAEAVRRAGENDGRVTVYVWRNGAFELVHDTGK